MIPLLGNFKRKEIVSHLVAEYYLGPTITARGKIETEHDIYIDCNYTGEIHTEGLVEIDANARVKANIKCRAITIAGKLEGKVIAAQHITAQANADIKGHLEAPVVEVAQGAILNANVLTDPKKGL